MWIIQSVHEGPLHLNDIGLMLTHGQTRDLDLMGREKAERSNDVKIALNTKPPYIKTIRKDAYAPEATIDIGKLQEASQQTLAAAASIQGVAAGQSELIARMSEQLQAQMERNKHLEEQIAKQGAQTQQVLDNTEKVLAQVKAFAEANPLEIRSLKETLLNIQFEKQVVAKKIEELPSMGLSEAEMRAQERILKLKEAKLERNAETIGKSISMDAKDVQSELDALEKLGI